MKRAALLLCVLVLLAGAVAGGAQGSPAPSFEPASVTFVSLAQGWALGRARCGVHRCLALRATVDGGRSWSARPLPAALVAAADRRFSGAAAPYAVATLNVRFADPRNGWIYGEVLVAHHPGGGQPSYTQRATLWSTHDGGRRWHAVALGGLGIQDELFDLEAARATAWLMVSTRQPGVALRSTPVGADRWRAVRTPRLDDPAGGGPQTGDIVLADGAGWLVEGNDRGTIGSARLVGGRWVRWTPPCAPVGNSFAVPAAADARHLAAVCVMGGFAQGLTPSAPHGATLGSSWLYTSADGGASFRAGPALARRDAGNPAALGGPIASPVPGTVVLGHGDLSSGRQSMVATFDGGRHWRTVATGTPLFIGFTSPSQGVAIVHSAAGVDELLMTRDGGRTWTAVAF